MFSDEENEGKAKRKTLKKKKITSSVVFFFAPAVPWNQKKKETLEKQSGNKKYIEEMHNFFKSPIHDLYTQ